MPEQQTLTMNDAGIKKFLNPITLEAQIFLKAMEKYGPKYPNIDEELLNTMDKLVDAINKFYDQPLTKVEESEEIKLAKVDDLDCIERAYTCTKCHKYLGPSAEKVAHHITQHSDEREKRRARRKKLCDRASTTELKLPKKARALLNQKFSKLFREPVKTAEDLKQIPEYDQIKTELVDVIKPIFPGKTVKLYRFGSRISGIGNKNSDLDVFVDIGDSFTTFENRASEVTLHAIKEVSKVLHKDKKWGHVLAIQNARVPIIRVVHNSTNISCDIGFSNSLGYCNTMLMKYFFELQPIASRMCIFMKLWLERTKLNEHFSSYSMTLMVIFYLQIKEILPSVEELQSNLKNPVFVGPWISNFKELSLNALDLKPLDFTRSTFRDLLLDFFSFYSEFDFAYWVVCPYFGYMVKIDDINGRLPKWYKNFVKSNGSNSELQIRLPMVVQDPIQLNHNVTNSRSTALLKVFLDYIKDSVRILTQKGSSVEGSIESL